jgi:Xaa-Pro aminopeptidase
METIQPTLKRGRDVWDRINMPKTEFLDRVAKIKERMHQQGIDVLLLYANNGNDYAAPCYISNYIMKVPTGAIVAITKAGDVTLVCEGFARDVPGVKAATWVEDIRSCDDVSRTTVTFLKEKGLIPSTIGLVGLEQAMPHEQYRFFLKSTEGCALIPADGMISEMRTVKSPKEVDQVRRAGRIVGRIFGELSGAALPGLNEKTLEAMMARQAYLDGAEDVRMLIARPREDDCTLRPCEEVPLVADEPVILFLAVEFERYWAQAFRTFVYEKDSLIETDAEFVRTLYHRAEAGLHAGKEISLFCSEVSALAASAYVHIHSEYGLGQGIGLSLRERPFLSKTETSRLREGMCLSLRLAIKGDETGLAMTGETICLSKDGPEVLTRL